MAILTKIYGTGVFVVCTTVWVSSVCGSPLTNDLDEAARTNAAAEPSLYLQVDTPDESVALKEAQKAQYEAINKIAQKSLPLFFVEKDGAYRLRERSEEDTTKTLVLSSGYLQSFGHYLFQGNVSTNAYTWPVLQMGIDWDSSTDEYRLDRFGVGFFDERLWLMHEMEENEDEPGRYGIQLKHRW